MENEIANVTAVTEDEVQFAGAFPQIIVSGTVEKPFFEIVYLDLKGGDIHVGFGSYDLANVFQWLKEYFGETRAKIIDPEDLRPKGRWKFQDIDGWWFDECSICGGTIPNRDGSPPDYNYCPNCGAKMEGVK